MSRRHAATSGLHAGDTIDDGMGKLRSDRKVARSGVS
jgi:hypothetical protein